MSFPRDLGKLANPQGHPIWESSATEKFPPGSKFRDQYGRVFHYVKNGASALKRGNLVQAATLAGAGTTLQSQAAVAVAAAIGDKTIYVTAVSTAQSASVFADGWAAIYDATGTAGQVATIAITDNSALATSGTASYITLEEGIPFALTTSEKIALQANIFKSVIVAPASVPTGLVLGVCYYPLEANYYGWLQTWGLCGVFLNDVSTAVTAIRAIPGGTTAGSLNVEGEAAVAQGGLGDFTALWLDAGPGFVYLRCIPY